MGKIARKSTLHEILYSKEKENQHRYDFFLQGIEVTWLWMENIVFSFDTEEVSTYKRRC